MMTHVRRGRRINMMTQVRRHVTNARLCIQANNLRTQRGRKTAYHERRFALGEKAVFSETRF
jgi:hypothetical protein